MKIVVTGAGGFVGRQVVARLLARGATVVAVDVQTNGLPDGVRALAGDLADEAIRREALADGIDGLIHLATVPGGAAELDPVASRRINVDAGYDLIVEAAAVGTRPRFVYASSIAVLGDRLPEQVDDQTPLSPKLIYARGASGALIGRPLLYALAAGGEAAVAQALAMFRRQFDTAMA